MTLARVQLHLVLGSSAVIAMLTLTPTLVSSLGSCGLLSLKTQLQSFQSPFVHTTSLAPHSGPQESNISYYHSLLSGQEVWVHRG